jgi:RNA polymerase sigma factor (sigma-70 family)
VFRVFDESTVTASPAVDADDEVRRYLADALRLARMVVGNTTTAEDIASEAVARLLIARKARRVDAPEAYLRRIVVNQIIGRRRRLATERRHEHRFVAARISGDETEHIGRRDALEAALAELTPRQRAVLVLRFYEDLPEREVADLLGIPVGTVKSSAARALADLRALLGEDPNDG